MRPIDLLREAVAGITRRIARSVLTMLGTILGVGAFVTTLGLTATANAQIGQRFDVLKATEVRLEDAGPGSDVGIAFPNDTDQRLERLNGVRAAGRYWTVRPSQPPTALPGVASAAGSPEVPIVAASPGAVAATQPRVGTGRLFDVWHQQHTARVALLGRLAAHQLRVTHVSQAPAIFLDGVPFAIIGILDEVARDPEFLLSVVIPDTTALMYWGQRAIEGPAHVLIDVRPGAAQLIGRQAALAVRPDQPDRLQTVTPLEPKTLRHNVEQDTSALYLTLAAVTLLMSAFAIGNTTLVSVLERAPEIGLRRALGATRTHIATQFLTESAALGATGGLVGTVLGITAVTGLAIARSWTSTIPPLVILVAPLLGTVTGLVAGIYPAARAATIQPVSSLRGA